MILVSADAKGVQVQRMAAIQAATAASVGLGERQLWADSRDWVWAGLHPKANLSPSPSVLQLYRR